MDIYIQSCGIATGQDYHWRKIKGQEKKEQPMESPPNFFSQQVKNDSRQIKDFLEQGEPSLLLLKETEDNKQFILLITELNADKRSKIYGRGVSNIIVIIADAEEDKLIKGIFNYVKYNWESFREKIDKHINFDATNGFIVKQFSDFERYLKGLQKKNDYDRSKKSDEIKNVQELEIILSKEEKTRKKSDNSLILVAVFLIVLVVIVWLIVTNNEKKQETLPHQTIKEETETCQTMKNWHSPCLYLTNYPTIKEMEKQQIRQ